VIADCVIAGCVAAAGADGACVVAGVCACAHAITGINVIAMYRHMICLLVTA